jgi:NAD(P)-dependent dehydrogenase (short-subunit alcohol dehydrogenase family)
MHVGGADIDDAGVEGTLAELPVGTGTAIGVPTDVRDPAAMLRLRDTALDRFGAVHLLCNNAGVLLPQTPVWELSLADWHWVVDVNLWGVVHALEAFVPAMLASGQPGHVVNTCSNAGVVTVPAQAAYSATKYAVAALTETLFLDLQAAGANIGVSLLCPGAVRTGIGRSPRWHPDPVLGQGGVERLERQGTPSLLEQIGIDPADAAGAVVDAVWQRRFYVFTHPAVLTSVSERASRMSDGREPAVPPHLADYDALVSGTTT